MSRFKLGFVLRSVAGVISKAASLLRSGVALLQPGCGLSCLGLAGTARFSAHRYDEFDTVSDEALTADGKRRRGSHLGLSLIDNQH